MERKGSFLQDEGNGKYITFITQEGFHRFLFMLGQEMWHSKVFFIEFIIKKCTKAKASNEPNHQRTVHHQSSNSIDRWNEINQTTKVVRKKKEFLVSWLLCTWSRTVRKGVFVRSISL